MALELCLVDSGTVSCPYRNNEKVEVDECYRCQWFAGVRRLDGAEAIGCDTAFRPPAWLPLIAGRGFMPGR